MKLFRKTPAVVRRQPSSIDTRGRGVFSYHANRAADTQTRDRAGQRPKRKIRWHYLPSVVAALALLVSLGYILTLGVSPKVILAEKDHRLALRPIEAYQQAAQQLLAHSWFNRNKLTVDTGQVERGLRQQFPELDEVAVTLPLIGHRPVIELATVQPALLMTSNHNVYLVASNGKVVASGSETDVKGAADLPVLIDKSNVTINPGQSALPTDQVDFVLAIVAQFKAQHMSITSLTLPPAPNEIEARLKGLAYYIKFNTMLNARQQVGTFLAARQKIIRDHTTVGQYMDVRVDEKVFYK